MVSGMEKFELVCKVRHAVHDYNFEISNEFSDNISDIVKRRIIGYAVVQFNYGIVQPDDSAKYIKVMPVFENLQDENNGIEYDINLPACANVINILPVTNHAFGVFGGIPYERTTIEDISSNAVSCFKYALLGIETGNINSNDEKWKDRLEDLWTDTITENLYKLKIETVVEESKCL